MATRVRVLWSLDRKIWIQWTITSVKQKRNSLSFLFEHVAPLGYSVALESCLFWGKFWPYAVRRKIFRLLHLSPALRAIYSKECLLLCTCILLLVISLSKIRVCSSLMHHSSLAAHAASIYIILIKFGYYTEMIFEFFSSYSFQKQLMYVSVNFVATLIKSVWNIVDYDVKCFIVLLTMQIFHIRMKFRCGGPRFKSIWYFSATW